MGLVDYCNACLPLVISVYFLFPSISYFNLKGLAPKICSLVLNLQESYKTFLSDLLD